MKITKIIYRLFLLLTLTFSTACGEFATENPINKNINEDNSTAELQINIDSLPLVEPSEEIKADLIFMREEEKLARDVYGMLGEVWNKKVFFNIQKSEQNHMNALKILLDRYMIEDPVKSDEPGKFENAELQKLFNELIERGKSSEIEALKVGALIEEVDIADLVRSIEKLTDENSDIKIVYEHLIKGSENHLRAFVRNLKNRGVTYNPEILESDHFNNIILN
ncbi:MAG: DUF2202 domain-containing protein [Melioribacteraceae bacterium]|jgi:hypothetical protein|nr:DUF2202 domain-containing protein [Melioribacteraceae bacterium]